MKKQIQIPISFCLAVALCLLGGNGLLGSVRLDCDVRGSQPPGGGTESIVRNGGNGGNVSVQVGMSIDSGDGRDGDLISGFHRLGESGRDTTYQFRQVAPLRDGDALQLAVKGRVTIKCQFLFAPDVITRDYAPDDPAPELRVHAGRPLFIEPTGKTDAFRQHGEPHDYVSTSVDLRPDPVTNDGAENLNGGSFHFATPERGYVKLVVQADAGAGLRGSNGGRGGSIDVLMDAFSLDAQLLARGGPGAPATNPLDMNPAPNGGNGGDGGMITLNLGYDAESAQHNLADVSGGSGGMGAQGRAGAAQEPGGSAGNGGVGGKAGQIVVRQQGRTPYYLPIIAAAFGGNGGAGGTGGRGGYGAQNGARGGNGGTGGPAGHPGSISGLDDARLAAADRGKGGNGGAGGVGGDSATGGIPGAGGDGGDGGDGSGTGEIQPPRSPGGPGGLGGIASLSGPRGATGTPGMSGTVHLRIVEPPTAVAKNFELCDGCEPRNFIGSTEFQVTREEAYGWEMYVSVSEDDGLQLTSIRCEGRYMADFMMLPYFELETGSVFLPGQKGDRCELSLYDNKPFARSRLMEVTAFKESDLGAFSFNARPYTIRATYFVDRIGSGCLTISQVFRFYPPMPGLAEPTGFLTARRFKPSVEYQFMGKKAGVEVEPFRSIRTAQAQLFRPSGKSPNYSLLARDNALPEVVRPGVSLNYSRFPVPLDVGVIAQGGSPLRQESLFHAIVDGRAGEVDNLHVSYQPGITEPFQILQGWFAPYGCPECVHVHWRWLRLLGISPLFDANNGEPFVPAGSRQSVDVACSLYIPTEERMDPVSVESLISPPLPIMGQPHIFWYLAKSTHLQDEFFSHGGFFKPKLEDDLTPLLRTDFDSTPPGWPLPIPYPESLNVINDSGNFIEAEQLTVLLSDPAIEVVSVSLIGFTQTQTDCTFTEEAYLSFSGATRLIRIDLPDARFDAGSILAIRVNRAGRPIPAVNGILTQFDRNWGKPSIVLEPWCGNQPGTISFRIKSPTDGMAAVELSSDLKHWLTYTNVALTNRTLDLTLPRPTGTNSFLRTVSNPSPTPPPPNATTLPATGLAPNSATLNGLVTPHGASTSARFDYGTTTNYERVTPTLNAGNGTTAAQVDHPITGLEAGTTYHFRLVASNDNGTHYGADLVFTTPGATGLGSALDNSDLTWSSGGDAPWLPQTGVTHDDSDAARSGAILDFEESWIETTVTGPGTLSFWWKVSSEEDFDFLSFEVDDDFLDISGEVDWRRESLLIAPGTHVLRWSYSKDDSVSSGQDAGWVDQVGFTP